MQCGVATLRRAFRSPLRNVNNTSHSMRWAERAPFRPACNTTDGDLPSNSLAQKAGSGLPSSRAFGWGIAGLVGVSFLWGTYSPAVKLLYAAPDLALTPASLTATRAVLEAGVLTASAALGILLQQRPSAKPQGGMVRAAKGEAGSRKGWAPLLALLAAGLELGAWNFVGNSLEAQALSLTTASKSAFLVQLTLVFVPLLSAVVGYRVPPAVWAACLLGLLGGGMLATDGQPTSDVLAGLLDFKSWGGSSEACLLGACFCYAAALVRLQALSPTLSSLQLAAAKKAALALFSVAWLLASSAAGSHPLESLLQHLASATTSSLGVLAYVALASGALAAVLQTKSLSIVPASQAQVILSITPVWAVLFSPSDHLSSTSWIGGSLVLAAGVIAARASGGISKSIAKPSG